MHMQTIQLHQETSQVIKANGCRPDFHQTLAQHKRVLLKDKITTLQINVGLLCNQTCRHCHLDAGPGRKEMMSAKTLDQIVAFARCGHFPTIDITGGAPELHPLINDIIQRLNPLCGTLIFRSNLTALAQKGNVLINHLKDNQVTLVVSLPSLYKVQAESVRGKGSFHTSIQTLKKLNELGYGKEHTGLKLDLVVNPTGAFLPPAQSGIEKRYHKVLSEKWGVVFNELYSFANVPLGRFRNWLIESGNYEQYMQKLASVFNPCTVDGLMCRNIMSVSWDGYLFDCDFNQAISLFMGNLKKHISERTQPPEPGNMIAIGNHCYTCTAGSGFT